jgi:hypothetical protein
LRSIAGCAFMRHAMTFLAPAKAGLGRWGDGAGETQRLARAEQTVLDSL